MARVASSGVLPISAVETEEELQILWKVRFGVDCSKNREKFTPIKYVCEQYMSPRKKSRNSTGYSPARSSLNYERSAGEEQLERSSTYV